MKKIPQLLFGLLCLTQHPGIAQNHHKIDSLNRLLSTNIPDTSRVKTYLGLAEERYLASPMAAIKDCEEAKKLAEKINYSNGLSLALGWLAYLYEQVGEVDKALDHYKKSYEIFDKEGDEDQAATCLNNMAAIYKDQGRVEEALLYHDKCLSIKTRIGDKEGIATSYNNIALIYQNQGRILEALDFYSKSLKIYEGIKNLNGVATALENLGSVYKDQKQYRQASDYFYKSLGICTKLNDKYSIGYTFNALGGLYEDQNKLDSALYYFEKSLKTRIEIDDKQGIAYSWRSIGNIYLKLGQKGIAKDAYGKSLKYFEGLKDKWGTAMITNQYGALLAEGENYELGKKYLLQSLQTARELGYPADIRNAANNLQQLYRRKKEWKEALWMNDLYIQMRDSVQNDNNHKASLQTQFHYEYEKKETLIRAEQEKKDAIAQKELQKQKLVRNGFMGGFLVVLLFAGVFFRQRNKINKEKKRSDALLLNILPAEVANELKQTGGAQAKQFDNVTVLFTDFVNFTLISERLSAQEIVEELHYCFTSFDKIIERYGLEKIKTIGDSYLAVCGLPNAEEHHAKKTVQAAIEIMAFINKRESEGGHFKIRVGINSGTVVAGIVGVKKFAYDIWGDTVNTAARMEQHSQSGKINISGSTYELVKQDFQCVYRGKIEAKNKGEVDMYFVEIE